MTNTNKHQSKHFIFSGQAHLRLDQHFSPSGFVLPPPSTNSVSHAGSPRSLPLAVEEIDNSRDLALQPAPATGVRPRQPRRHRSSLIWKQGRSRTGSVPLHTRPAKRGVGREIFSATSSGTNTLRPDTGARTQAHRHPDTGEELQYTDNIHASEELVERPRRGVWQDNDRISRDREASAQPAAVKEFTRSQATSRSSTRSQKVDDSAARTVPVQVWVRPLVKETLVRLARQDGLSLSSAGAALLERALQQNIDLQYSALLQPIIEKAIAKQMRGISTRLAWLLVRVSMDSGQTRSLVTNILGRQQGMTTDLLRSIVKQSAATARGNITRRTPQLEDVIQAVEQWILTDEKSDRGQSN